MSTTPTKAGQILAWVGVALQAGWPIGVTGTVMGMMSAFTTMGTIGVGDPSHSSAAIGEVLISTFCGIFIASLGLVPVIVSVTFCHYRARWLFWFCTLYGGLVTLLLSPFGLFLMIFALVKRHEFFQPSGT